MTQKSKLVKMLTRGEVTPQQATRAGITNFFKLITQLRAEGTPVYTNEGTGPRSHSYRIGTPSKLLVAAAYRAYGNQVFATR